MDTADKNKSILESLHDRMEYYQKLIETKMIDPDGLVYSFINENTQKPFRDSDLPDNARFEVVAAPTSLWKAGFWNYEDCDLTTAQYLLSHIYRYQVTKESFACEIARRCFRALQKVADAGARYQGATYKPMFGFLPKPYGGVKTAHLSGETSVDQYQHVMIALELYRDTLASAQEKKWINRFLVACAECWDVNNYTFRYFSKLVRWGIDSPHSVAFGLYCSTVGAKLGNQPHQEGWFKVFMNRTKPLECKLPYPPDASLTMLAMKRLMHYRPELKNVWFKYAQKIFAASMKGVDENGYEWFYGDVFGQKRGQRIKPHWEPGYCGDWKFEQWRGNIRMPARTALIAAVDMYELDPKPKYLQRAMHLLTQIAKNDYLRYLEPLTKKDLPRGYEYLGKMISGPNTAMWLQAYWHLKYLLNNKKR
jgi:hypothetical protein